MARLEFVKDYSRWVETKIRSLRMTPSQAAARTVGASGTRVLAGGNRQHEVLTEGALSFLENVIRRFGPRVHGLVFPSHFEEFLTVSAYELLLDRAAFELAQGYRAHGMSAYSRLQQAEFAAESTGYFDEVTQVISSGTSSTIALKESTETAQF